MDKLARYMTKANLSRCFGVSLPTVYRRLEGIQEETKRGGRYNGYSVFEDDGLISIAVFADYLKYHKRLGEKNLRRTVPDFDRNLAIAHLEEVGVL